MKKRKQEKVLKIITSVIIIFIVGSFLIIWAGNRPLRKARSEARQVAAEIAGIQRMNDFYWFTREKTYFTVLGTDEKGNNLTVFIPDDGSEAVIMNQDKGTTEDEVIRSILEKNSSDHVKKVSLGIQKGKPVWEIVTSSKEHGLTYYLVDYSDLKIVEEIKNV
ncbi:cell wall elongation regulator TseB-like domain-containing protein [Vagococcus vulneris]|uniref:Cell wall elongation regulator TseB-like domain-containing protein n=1 Tax=Vagococcus vulneris TaxID=1977869 RepID=A0A429ZWX1_9ENTE|nr:DUF5590 domain-containing protein [Vagococcus vulneris]RST98315.1 hypothetical protein CBF37_08375 [Vagococcus vulneris]